MMYRQGDILLEQIDGPITGTVVPRDAAGRVVLAYGEATGHAHAFMDDQVTLRDDRGRRTVEIVAAPATLLHPEHAPITVPPALYLVRRQQTYTPERPRLVVD